MRSTRRAFSLLEMLIVITVTAAIVAAACTMLVATIRTNDALSAQLRDRQSFDRLDKQLRRDLQAASGVKLTQNAAEAGVEVLQLTGNNVSIEYRANSKYMLRRELNAAEEAVRTEKYAWSRPLLPRWQVEESGPGQVTLAFDAASAESPLTPAWKALRITGVVGSDHRYEKPREP